jgi:hypothetical protein
MEVLGKGSEFKLSQILNFKLYDHSEQRLWVDLVYLKYE